MTTSDLIGLRIKTVRRQRGLSQAQLAHPELSDSYISLIESGKRTPTPAVLELLAQKLDCSLSYLLNGVTAEQMEDLELAIGYANLALENGEALEARVRFAELLADNNLTGLTALRQAAQFGLARAYEACGDQVAAIATLRQLDEEADLSQERRTELALALCRLYRTSGRTTEAVEVGERMLATRTVWSDVYVELAATLLAAYYERGDLLRARQFAAELLDAAESIGSPRALVAANWNAAITASMIGHGEDVFTFAERALAIQVEHGTPRLTAGMYTAVAYYYLRLRPQSLARARELLERGIQLYSESSATALEQANARLELAHAAIIAGDLDEALRSVEESLTLLPGTAGTYAVEAQLLKSRALGFQNRTAQAAAELDLAVTCLESLGGDHLAIRYWYGAAENYELIQDVDRAVDAYQKALVAAGL